MHRRVGDMDGALNACFKTIQLVLGRCHSQLRALHHMTDPIVKLLPIYQRGGMESATQANIPGVVCYFAAQLNEEIR